jgi:hypothetical protein
MAAVHVSITIAGQKAFEEKNPFRLMESDYRDNLFSTIFAHTTMLWLSILSFVLAWWLAFGG